MMIPSEIRLYVMSRDGHRCDQCGSGVHRHLEVDHVLPDWHLRRRAVPLSQVNATWNLRVLCRACNQKKGATLPDEALIKTIRDRDRMYQEGQQAELDACMDPLYHPFIEEFHQVWEHLAHTSAKLGDGVNRDLDPHDIWREIILDALLFGITEDALYSLACKVHAEAVTSAWGFFSTVLTDWVNPPPTPSSNDETLFDVR